MKTKRVDIGRVTGLSSYELAVKHGFTGTEEEYVNRENSIYNDMQQYADDSKAEMNRLLGTITDSDSANLAEVIASRGSYDTLSDRLSASDNELTTILQRLESLDGGNSIVDKAFINNDGYLVITVKDGPEAGVYGNIELRKYNAQIQWRSTGFKDWQTLVTLRELTPVIADVIINMIGYHEEASGKVELIGDEEVITLNIPSAFMRTDETAGQILDGTVNENGELILTVANHDYVTVSDADRIVAGMPILSIGKVTAVDYTEEPSATITGTPTNPILNLSIPKGKPTKLNSAYVGEDGFLVFDYM